MSILTYEDLRTLTRSEGLFWADITIIRLALDADFLHILRLNFDAFRVRS
jgi:hypothetical protein